MQKQYGFIVDTNLYTGNFEREMCAFMTGHVGECGVGIEEVDLYEEQYVALEDIEQVRDDEDCSRPVSAYPTPNIWNNGLGFEYKNGEEDLALQEFRKSTCKYYESLIEQVENYRGKNLLNWTDEAIDTTVNGYRHHIEDAENLIKPHKYPAYMSLIIYFSKKPTDKIISFLKQRAEEYELFYGEGLKITGYRLLEIITQEIITEI